MAYITYTKTNAGKPRITIRGKELAKSLSKTFPFGTTKPQMKAYAESMLASLVPSPEPEKAIPQPKEPIPVLAGSFGEMAKSYLDNVMTLPNGIQRSSYYLAAGRVRTLSKHLGSCIFSIDKVMVNSFVRHRLAVDKVAESTVKGDVQVLSRIINHAIDYYDYDLKSFLKPILKRLGNGKPREHILNDDGMNQMLRAVDSKYRNYYELLYLTACRRSELLFLVRSDIHLKERYIQLHGDKTKNGESRKVPLNQRALELLRAELELTSGELFRFKKYTVSQHWRRVRREQGIQVVLHGLRHSACTKYAKKGLSTLQLQAVSGHKSLAMLNRYSHLDASDVVDLLD